MAENKPKIYLACSPAAGWGAEDVVGYALAEDGQCLAQHLSSNVAWSQHDMGLTSDWKHDVYAEHYPDGYELEWVDDPHTHEGWLKAMELNKKLADEAKLGGC